MLLAEGLGNQISQVFALKLSDKQEIAKRVANAYMNYALAAQGPIGDPVLVLPPCQVKLSAVLFQIMAGRLPPPLAANSMSLAMLSFWIAPPVLTAGGGLTTIIVPAAAIAKLITISASSSDDAGKKLADSLDTATRTVIVTYPAIPMMGPLM